MSCYHGTVTFEDSFKQLIAFCRSSRDFEPQIVDAIGKYREMGIFADGGLFHLFVRVRAWAINDRLVDPSEGLFLSGLEFFGKSRNTRILLAALQREVFLMGNHPICNEHNDPTERRFLFPFVIPGCFKTDGPMGTVAYYLDTSTMTPIRQKAREFFQDVSFENPILFNALYPPSSFRLSNPLNRQLYASAFYLANQIYYGALPPIDRPRFEHLAAPELIDYDPDLDRDYGFLFGVAFLKLDSAIDPLAFVRSFSTNGLRVDYQGGFSKTIVSRPNSSHGAVSREITCSRLTINRPLPALEGYEHFIRDIKSSDSAASNFWLPYEK